MKLFEQVDIFTGGRDGYHTYRIPALVVANNGAVLAFCEGRKNSEYDDGDIDLMLKRSFDNGKTWENMQLVWEEDSGAPITIGNPCPIVDRQTGEIHLLFTRNNQRAFYIKSTDDGVLFSKPTEITTMLKDFPFTWKRIGSGPCHGIQIGTGRLIATVWLNLDKNYRSAVIYSDDHGKTWKIGGVVGPEIKNTNECSVYETSDGSLCLNMRGGEAGYRAIAISQDNGLTWSKPKLDKNLPDPACQGSTLRLPSYNDKSCIFFSNVAVHSTFEEPKTRHHLTVRLSYDDGKTWSFSRLINEDPSGYSDLAVTQDKAICCLYENGNKHPYEKLTFVRFNIEWLTN